MAHKECMKMLASRLHERPGVLKPFESPGVDTGIQNFDGVPSGFRPERWPLRESREACVQRLSFGRISAIFWRGPWPAPPASLESPSKARSGRTPNLTRLRRFLPRRAYCPSVAKGQPVSIVKHHSPSLHSRV